MSIKPRVFKAKLADIINLVDAIFDGNREMPGWVIMAANAKGRECINALFPHAPARSL
jgi:ribosomal protein L39E